MSIRRRPSANPRKEDRETRYFLDIDVRTRKVLDWGFDQRAALVIHEPAKPSHLRIYLTRGQFNKLENKSLALASQG